MMNIIIENLTHKYQTQTVLDNININLKDVSSLAIIGASGCGKSTLMRLMSGIENPFCGSITIDGVSPVSQKKLFQSKIGYVFQKHNLFKHLSVYDNLMLVMHKIKKIPKNEADIKIKELLKQFKIENESHKKPHEISGGQAQRASIARAIATNPEILFLDEPTASLDPILTTQVLKTVSELKNSGSEFIFITHEIDFLKDFAQYVIFIDNGKIIEHGNAEILKNPKTNELKNFLFSNDIFRRDSTDV